MVTLPLNYYVYILGTHSSYHTQQPAAAAVLSSQICSSVLWFYVKTFSFWYWLLNVIYFVKKGYHFTNLLSFFGKKSISQIFFFYIFCEILICVTWLFTLAAIGYREMSSLVVLLPQCMGAIGKIERCQWYLGLIWNNEGKFRRILGHFSNKDACHSMHAGLVL